MASNIVGRVTQVLGAVVDVQFPGELPFIQNALRCKIDDRTLVLARPDQHVAWRGDEPPENVRALIDLIRGVAA